MASRDERRNYKAMCNAKSPSIRAYEAHGRIRNWRSVGLPGLEEDLVCTKVFVGRRGSSLSGVGVMYGLTPLPVRLRVDDVAGTNCVVADAAASKQWVSHPIQNLVS